MNSEIQKKTLMDEFNASIAKVKKKERRGDAQTKFLTELKRKRRAKVGQKMASQSRKANRK